MKTNQNPVQEQPAQPIAPETSATVQSGQPPVPVTEQPNALSLPEHEPELQSAQPAEQLYDPNEAAQIVRHLTDGYFDPEYILLFGKLVGGTPHSDALAYDLLMVVRETPEYDWIRAKRILRYRMPYRHRKITYINLYILPLNYVESNWTPFLYFARAEGEVLYCNDHHHFRRPKHPCNFAAAYADAKFHFDTYRTLGYDLIEQARDAFVEGRNVRLGAQFTAQAIVYFYHMLYYVYHGMEFDLHDPVVMHDRMRTLSTKLMLVFDDNHIENIFTLPCLKQVLLKTPYSAEFYMAPQELEMHMDRVQKAAEIIESYAELRLELYKELSER
ncbi:nucleotidyltransferase domain-containing protein [Alistipes sp.]|uniref:nucleotidyltransferase domain-containing protein n=1 Tax=Alistipes sp. TaxID=1872444 RepID=UPI0011C9D692